MENIYDLASAYADKLIQSEDFQRLLKLKKEIEHTLSKQIIGFKTAEAKYMEVKRYGSYHPDLEKYQKIFVEKKKALYQEPLIREYKSLERKIQLKLDKDLDDLKSSISNKFNLSKSISLE